MIELEFRNVDFCGGRKTGEPGEKPLKQQQTQLTYHAESGNQTRDHGGERRVSCCYATLASLPYIWLVTMYCNRCSDLSFKLILISTNQEIMHYTSPILCII
jgi:hypothetical protein